MLANNAVRKRLAAMTEQMIAVDYVYEPLKAAAQAWLDTLNDSEKNPAVASAYIAALEDGVLGVDEAIAFLSTKSGAPWDGFLANMQQRKAAGEACCDCPACNLALAILKDKDFLVKKSIWAFGGDGWAYDIGFGGLDHVIAQNEDINLLVFDTEVYSNTGGQASKATPTGAVAKFAASGKEVKKKDLAQIAMSYGYVYVAQVAMGADYNQCLKAFAEAEAYPGPSIVIAYAPCINHGIKGGMGNGMAEMKAAVDAGYWHMFRFDPRLKAQGKNPFQLDSKAPTADYRAFIESEVRYSSLKRAFPDRADGLYDLSAQQAKDKWEHLEKMQRIYGE
jgi:pyruvate-ferredoxin/flavodoxin oxidoreductase